MLKDRSKQTNPIIRKSMAYNPYSHYVLSRHFEGFPGQCVTVVYESTRSVRKSLKYSRSQESLLEPTERPCRVATNVLSYFGTSKGEPVILPKDALYYVPIITPSHTVKKKQVKKKVKKPGVVGYSFILMVD